MAIDTGFNDIGVSQEEIESKKDDSEKFMALPPKVIGERTGAKGEGKQILGNGHKILCAYSGSNDEDGRP